MLFCSIVCWKNKYKYKMKWIIINIHSLFGSQVFMTHIFIYDRVENKEWLIKYHIISVYVCARVCAHCLVRLSFYTNHIFHLCWPESSAHTLTRTQIEVQTERCDGIMTYTAYLNRLRVRVPTFRWKAINFGCKIQRKTSKFGVCVWACECVYVCAHMYVTVDHFFV